MAVLKISDEIYVYEDMKIAIVETVIDEETSEFAIIFFTYHGKEQYSTVFSSHALAETYLQTTLGALFGTQLIKINDYAFLNVYDVVRIDIDTNDVYVFHFHGCEKLDNVFETRADAETFILDDLNTAIYG